MFERSIGKVVANGNSLQVSIPRPMLHRLGWRLGTQIVVEQRDGCLVIAEVEYAYRHRALERVTYGLPPSPEVER